MILEGLVTTLDAQGQPHLAPMGPRVDERLNEFLLRPFRTSQTYANLKRHGEGVLHITDNVELLARAAVGEAELPALEPAAAVRGFILADCCRWFAFRVLSCHDASERAEFTCRTVDRGSRREFFGFNRAKHAVLEAAILATRIGLLPPAEIESELARLAIIVRKTAGPQELRAFNFLANYARRQQLQVPEI